jgi:hypothetical protein
MTYVDPNDPNRRSDPRYANEERNSAMAWGVLAVLAILVIGGFLLYHNTEHTQTASNAPAVTQPAPTPAPATSPPAKQ